MTQSSNIKEMQLYWRKKLGLDLPLFYFSLHRLSEPGSLYKIYDKPEKEALERLIDKYGNRKEIYEYHNSLLKFENDLGNLHGNSFSNTDEFTQLKYEARSLKYKYEDNTIQSGFYSIGKLKLPSIGISGCCGDG